MHLNAIFVLGRYLGFNWMMYLLIHIYYKLFLKTRMLQGQFDLLIITDHPSVLLSQQRALEENRHKINRLNNEVSAGLKRETGIQRLIKGKIKTETCISRLFVKR